MPAARQRGGRVIQFKVVLIQCSADITQSIIAKFLTNDTDTFISVRTMMLSWTPLLGTPLYLYMVEIVLYVISIVDWTIA